MQVLVINDSQEEKDTLTYYLKDAGHTAFQARNSVEIKRLLTMQNIDLILLGETFQNLNSFTLMRRIRQSYIQHWVPIIVIGEAETKPMLDYFMQSDSDEYLVKPVSFHELNSRLDAIEQLHFMRVNFHESEDSRTSHLNRFYDLNKARQIH